MTLISYASNKGYIGIHPEGIPNELKNKRIIIQDLDIEGNIIQECVANESDKDTMLASLVAKYGFTALTPQKALLNFTDEERKIINYITDDTLKYLTEKRIKEFRNLFDKHGSKKIDFAMKMSFGTQYDLYSNAYFFSVQLGSEYARSYTFYEALEFIEQRDGIYYAITRDGQRHWDFVDKPTKKQARYQRNKHGNRIVFKSFTDWKEYLVSEDELE
ncbi:hypothetical protein COF09_28945 [Bacillus toyonensis]|uniref:hypothetical protein n=1 Tax=Bacillus toyonensis TaxID=155322 RepID=UPI000BFC09D1|nr:hypothetical protein [Bacillus toyonensis]PHC36789.1 hypothetical protein COF09_28945 [Bacillus toyonensis]